MPYRAANAVPIGANWSQAATFGWNYGSDRLPRVLTAFVNGTDAVVQVLEDGEAFEENQAKEILFRQGFNTQEFPTPFVAWRFRVWSGTLLAPSGTIDFTVKA